MRTNTFAVKSFVLLTLVLQFCQMALQGQSAFLTNGLVAFYPFTGDTKDGSGNGHNASNLGAVPTLDRFGAPESAFDFNGTNAWMVVADAPDLEIEQSITISAWFNARTFSDQSTNYPGFQTHIVSKRENTGWGTGYQIETGTGPQGSYPIADWTIDGVDGWVHGPGGTIATGVWQNFVFTYDGTNAINYVNGNAVATVPQTGLLGKNSLPLTIGKRGGEGPVTGYFDGALDDIRIYNRALSPQEVKNLFVFENPPPGPRRARAIAQIVNGFVVGARIIDAGWGYTNPPTVLVVSGDGSGATATAQIGNGMVTSISITGAGSGYTGTVKILIGSPPFLPSLSIGVSRVNVTLSIVLGRKYQLESSLDLVTWVPQNAPFIAQDESITEEFVVSETGQYFRIREVP